VTPLRRAVGWLFGPETGERARTVEASLAVLIALRIALSPFRDLSGLPAGLYRPPFFLTGLHTIPSSGTILVLQVVGLLGALVVLGPPGRARRVGFAVAWLCLLVLAGFRDSRGKIMHNDLLLLWAAAPFLLAAADLRLRDRQASSRAGWPVRVSMTLVAFVYFFAGWAKVRRSGPGWAFSDNVQWVLRWGADTTARAPWPDFTLWVADHRVLALVGSVGTLGLELTFPIVLFSARLRPLYAAGAVALHVSTAALLGYDYWLWAAVDLVVLVDWPRLVRR
jgi:hypothetical protein